MRNDKCAVGYMNKYPLKFLFIFFLYNKTQHGKTLKIDFKKRKHKTNVG